MYGAEPLVAFVPMGFGRARTFTPWPRRCAAPSRIARGSPAIPTSSRGRRRVPGGARPRADRGAQGAHRAQRRPTRRSSSRRRKRERATSSSPTPRATSSSLTTTVNGPFGASIVAGDTGILLNNELDDFTPPEDGRTFGSEGWRTESAPRPRARPVSSMTPTIVLEDGEPILAVGGSGGTRIATGVTQATLARLHLRSRSERVRPHPRIHAQGADSLRRSRDPARRARRRSRARGETVKDEPFTRSAIQMIAWQRTPGCAREHARRERSAQSGLQRARASLGRETSVPLTKVTRDRQSATSWALESSRSLAMA